MRNRLKPLADLNPDCYSMSDMIFQKVTRTVGVIKLFSLIMKRSTAFLLILTTSIIQSWHYTQQSVSSIFIDFMPILLLSHHKCKKLANCPCVIFSTTFLSFSIKQGMSSKSDSYVMKEKLTPHIHRHLLWCCTVGTHVICCTKNAIIYGLYLLLTGLKNHHSISACNHCHLRT